MKEVRVRAGQTVFDVCLEQYGSVEGTRYILEDNPGVELENVSAGDILIIRDAPIDTDTKSIFSNKIPTSNG